MKLTGDFMRKNSHDKNSKHAQAYNQQNEDERTFGKEGIDNGRIAFARNNDYYTKKDDQRRFGPENNESYSSEDRLSPQDQNSWRNVHLNSTLFKSADAYGENIGNQKNNNEKYNFFGKGPKGWKRSDEMIREDVCEALYRDVEVDASSIEVSVKDALVTLKGHVENRHSKKEAEKCVENISGVEDVYNELKVVRLVSSSISTKHLS